MHMYQFSGYWSYPSRNRKWT